MKSMSLYYDAGDIKSTLTEDTAKQCQMVVMAFPDAARRSH